MRGFGSSGREPALAMSQGDSPWGNGRGDDGQGPEPAGDGADAPGDAPGRNPWLNPEEETAPRRSARIDDILRSRGGGGSGGNGSGRRVRMVPWLTLGLVSAWLMASSIHVLARDERALLTTLGRYSGTLGPGLNITLPWPFQAVDRRVTGKEETTVLPDKEAETLMPTRDGKLVNLSFQIRWRIGDLRRFAYNLPEGEAAIRRLADAQMRAAVAEFDYAEIINGKRQAELQQRVAGRMERVLDAWQSGVVLAGVEVPRTGPPTRLADTFKKIAQAREGQRKNRQDALDWRARRLAEARAEADAFNQIYPEYKLAPAVTRQRMYYETMERVLRNNDKVVLGGTNGPAGPSPDPQAPAGGR
ncbi:protease modulator HflK [Novosphingobium sp.]|uniref:protease modulator HflK n=1 Tax=Novosphingobium sp. TaxID=1874826 RepID=UPI0025D60CCB|nr:protease modulator HflK [Novosphingobium sp.]MCC6926526.1 protease modulator HflK [Novosphingobium sp.]